MAQIWKVRLPDGRTVRPTEWSSTPLWSTVEIGAGAQTPLFAFSYGRGGAVPGSVGPRNSTLVDTNMRGDGDIIPENEELLIYSIMAETFAIATNVANFFTGNDPGCPDPPLVGLRNLLRFQRDVNLELRIAEVKNYYDHPVGFFPASMGTNLYLGAARSAGSAFANSMLVGTNGSTSSFDNRRVATPHQVQPGEAFSVSFNFPFGQITNLNFGADANARLRVRVYADGYRRRPVA